MTAHDPRDARQFARQIVIRLRKAGYQALWAGGCVRDQLLGSRPKDYDVATSATPTQVRQCFGQRRTLAIGEAFGVVMVIGSRRQGRVEVATFRRDLGYSDGRHPDGVEYGTAEQDAQRRDFTINGLFFDPLNESLIDYVGGQDDLQRRLVRAIGDANLRFAEDKLRMIRAVRFATTLGFSLDPATLQAIQRHAHEIELVSAERIAEELRRILPHADRATGVRLMHASGLLAAVLPATARSGMGLGMDQQEWLETLRVLEQLENPSFPLALAALLRKIRVTGSSKVGVAPLVGAHWRLSNEETGRTAWIVEHESTIQQADRLPWPRLQKVLVAPQAVELMALVEAVQQTTASLTRQLTLCRQRLALPPDQLNPAPLIDGRDLLAMGLQAGPVFRVVLRAVRDAQLLQQIASPQEALELAKQVAQQEDQNCMDKKSKKKLDVIRQKLQMLRQQLSGARKQADEPDEVERLEAAIRGLEADAEKLKNA